MAVLLACLALRAIKSCPVATLVLSGFFCLRASVSVVVWLFWCV